MAKFDSTGGGSWFKVFYSVFLLGRCCTFTLTCCDVTQGTKDRNESCEPSDVHLARWGSTTSLHTASLYSKGLHNSPIQNQYTTSHWDSDRVFYVSWSIYGIPNTESCKPQIDSINEFVQPSSLRGKRLPRLKAHVLIQRAHGEEWPLTDASLSVCLGWVSRALN